MTKSKLRILALLAGIGAILAVIGQIIALYISMIVFFLGGIKDGLAALDATPPNVPLLLWGVTKLVLGVLAIRLLSEVAAKPGVKLIEYARAKLRELDKTLRRREYPIFSHAVKLGNGAVYHFTVTDSLVTWLTNELPRLHPEVCSKLHMVELLELPFLTVGDKCHVLGDGDDEFVIVDIVQLKEHYYKYELDDGRLEPIEKCYPIGGEAP